jgi:nucleoside-diphosphate-sugar epimerase
MGATGSDERRTVLLTGAAGRIGSAFFEHGRERYRFRLTVRDTARVPPGAADHDVMQLDVADPAACQEACRGIDTVVHLAADPSPEADFYGSLLDDNIKGTYNVFRAAKDQGCRRVVYASSVNAVIGYPPDVSVRPDQPVFPANVYGVTKCFGEALGIYFAETEGLPTIAVRIGAYEAPWVAKDPSPETLAMFVSRRDLNQLLERCVETPDISFAILHGVSDNRTKRLDLTTTRELLGYAPVDDGFALYGGT